MWSITLADVFLNKHLKIQRLKDSGSDVSK